MSAPDAGLSRQAMRLVQQGQFAQAEPLLQRLIQSDADNWQHALLLGLCRRGQGDLEGALQWLRRAVSTGDGQTSTHYHLGRLLAESGDADGAREQFSQVNALDPNHVEARTATAEVSMMRGQFKRAAGEFKVALRANRKHIPAMNGLAQASMELGENEEAWQLLENVLGQDVGHPVALSLRARILIAAGQLEAAEQSLRLALKRVPQDAVTHALLGQVLVGRGQHMAALEPFRKALEGGAASPDLVMRVVESLRKVGDLVQARRLLEDAGTRWPGHLGLGLRRAELAAASGQTAQAMALLDLLDPENPAVALTRARIRNESGEPEIAEGLLKPLLDVEDTDVANQARLLLTIVRARLAPEDLDRAREPIAPMLDRDPADVDALLCWATVCERHGRYRDARDALQTLMDRTGDDHRGANPRDARLLSTALGNVHDRMDAHEKAWRHWQGGGWREIPIAPRLAQHSTVLGAWLEHGRFPEPVAAFDDDRPAPVIVGGWPGSGRTPLLAGLAAHPDVARLDATRELVRLEALGIPAGPAELSGLNRESLLLVRKRFLRGIRGDAAGKLLLEPGWWSAAMWPALLLAFPEACIVLPKVDPADLRVQWLNDGYARVDALVAELERELALISMIRDQIGPQVIEIEREAVVSEPEAAFDEVCAALSLSSDPTARQAVMAQFEAMRFVPSGRGRLYAPFAEETGAE